MWEMWVRSLGLEDPLEEGWQPTPVFLPGEFYGQRSLAGYSPLRQRVGQDWSDSAHIHSTTQANQCFSHIEMSVSRLIKGSLRSISEPQWSKVAHWGCRHLATNQEAFCFLRECSWNGYLEKSHWTVREACKEIWKTPSLAPSAWLECSKWSWKLRTTGLCALQLTLWTPVQHCSQKFAQISLGFIMQLFKNFNIFLTGG